MEKLALTIINNGQNWTIKPPDGVPNGAPGMGQVIIKSGINILLVVAALLGLAFLAWGGLDYITSEGQKDKVSRSKRKILFAIIGLTVAFLAFMIIGIVESAFNINLLGRG